MRALAPLLAVLLTLFAVPPAYAAESAPVRSERAVATLVSDTDTVAPGVPFRLGLRLRMAPGWHTYWKNPGDAGVPPELDFTLPQGLTAGPLSWPAPARQPEDTLVTYGYSGEVLLASAVSGSAEGDTVPVKVSAHWLVCEKLCVPEEGTFSLDLRRGTPHPSAEAGLFQAADARLPRPAPWPATIAGDGTLVLSGPDLPQVTEAWFAPDAADVIVPGAAQKLVSAPGRLELALTPGSAFRAGTGLSGVVVMRDQGGQESALAVSAAPGATGNVLPLWQVLGFAFLGGLILNLMPCVFPVLAMKALGLAALAGHARRTARMHAVAYAAGVLVTFLLMAFGLLALRAGGAAVGWGFQFQSPVFVAGMAVLLFVMGLNLSGVFAISAPALTGAATKPRLAGSFFTGLLAVLVATPCTAPFMGAAIAAGLAGTPVTTVAVFAALGLGLAAPQLLVTLVPVRLPRPGAWMEVLRQILAFPMYGAAAWLAWVLSVQAGADGVLALAAALVLAGMAAWALGVAQRGNFRRSLLVVTGLAALACAVAVARVDGQAPPLPASAAAAATQAEGEPFSPARLAALRAAGRPVFVNMTAAWCVTCLVNERVALGTGPVREAFAAHNVAYLKGDWTRADPAITAFLRDNGRDGVPLYLFYPANGKPPVTLPQLLTPDTVLSALN